MTASLDPVRVEGLVAALFGIRGSATKLPSEIDENWRIDSPDAGYVMRLSHPRTGPADLALELDALNVLRRADIGFEVPAVVPNNRGQALSTAPDGRVLRLLTWVSGTSYAHAPRSEDLDRSIGGCAGEMVLALAGLDAGGRSHTPWTIVDSTSFVQARMHRIPAETRRALVERIIEDVEASVHGRGLAQAVIHNDLNDLNVLVGGAEVTGVIDFGDMTTTYRVAEVAITATYAMFDRDDPLGVAERVVSAFSKLVPLDRDEAESVFDLIRARLAMSVSASSAQVDTGNAHQQVSALQAWELLERLEASDRALCSYRLAAAAGHGTTIAGAADIRDRRAATIGPSLSLAYAEPLHIVRGRGAYLYDHTGRRYLDCVNNVCHVGHAHPTVVRAATDQMAILNTNTRYLHPNLVTYAERLLERFGGHLEVCFLVNSGSEANELAVRLARAATGHFDMAVLDHAYHGNTTTTIDLSPYKFNRAGGQGRRPWVHVLPVPDSYRGVSGQAYDRAVRAALPPDVRLAALLAEALPGCGGQLVPPPGALAFAYGAARDSGGVVIADEIQTGFGRIGSSFWAYELGGVEPDIVTLGKPIGNGHPLGAVVTTRAIAEAFDNGMEYFNTFGGNPVSAAVGMAVLDVIDWEGLQAQAADVGGSLLAGLAALSDAYEVIGDVRGSGLFIGVDLVSDRRAKTPDPHAAKSVVEYAVGCGVLLGVDGPDANVVKIKPPLVFSHTDAARLLEVLESALATLDQAGPG